MPAIIRIGIDIGGTKIEGIALNSDGQELVRRRISTPNAHYDGLVEAICQFVREIQTSVKEKTSSPEFRIGFGIPGTICPQTNKVKNANLTTLIGHTFDRDLSDALACPIRMANDANCLTVSEAVDGAAAGAHIVFGVILGTGCGGGIAIDGRILEGLNSIAGEWGHNPLPWPQAIEIPGPPCYCGKSGCIETWLSGPGLERAYLEKSGEKLLAPDFVKLIRRGDTIAIDVFNAYLDRLARSLAMVLNIIDPDVVVFGGGLSNVDEIYQSLPERISEYVFSTEISTRFVRNQHGDSSGVRGAAWLWPADM